MGADLKGGVDSFEVGTCSGKSGFKCTTPRHLCWSFLPPLVRGPLSVILDGSEASAGRTCLALIDTCQPKMIAQNGFGQSWMSWPRCLQMRPRQRSMRERSRRRGAADGTQRRSSGCANGSPKVHGAKPGSDLWRVAVRLTRPVPRHSEAPPGMRQRLAFPPHGADKFIRPPHSRSRRQSALGLGWCTRSSFHRGDRGR